MVKFQGNKPEETADDRTINSKISSLYDEFVNRCDATDNKNLVETYRKAYISSLTRLLETLDLDTLKQVCGDAEQTERKINDYAIIRVMNLHKKSKKSKKQIWQQFGGFDDK
jgi:uncharacterized UPF0160 family protein